MSDVFNKNLPGDLAALLSDPRIVIPGESEVLEMVAEWTLAPSNTPTMQTSGGNIAADLQSWASAASSTTPAAV